MPLDPARVQEVFLAAAEKTDLIERSAYLEQACAGDTELRARVDALLTAHSGADSLLDASSQAPSVDETQAFSPGELCQTGRSSRTQEDDGDNDKADALALLGPPGRPDSLGRISHYEMLQVLGRGAFGIVFRAFDDMLQRVVAVKLLAPSLAATSPARKRFLREARASAPIQHENVVRVYEVGEQPLPYLVMEYLPGENLQQLLDRTGPLETADVVRIGRQIASGLAAAHEEGLIHRDIKPSNILIDNGPRKHVKISDFGLARAADDASLTRSGTVAGTPMFMSPEQTRGESLDHRSDLFSLGSVLYTMLSGHPPFRAETTFAVLQRVAQDTPRPLRDIIPETPDWLCHIIDRLHAKAPADRFQTAREVAELLADCEAQFKAQGRVSDLARIPAKPPIRSGNRSKLPWVLGSVAALSVLVFLILYGLGFDNLRRYIADQASLTIQPTDSNIRGIVVRKNGLELYKLGNTGGSVPVEPGKYDIEIWPKVDYAVTVERQTHSLGGATGQGVFQATFLKDVAVARGNAVNLTLRTQKMPEDLPKPAPEEVQQFVGHTGSVRTVALSPDGNLALSASGFPQGDKTVRLWNTATGKEVKHLIDSDEPMLTCAFSPDGKQAISAGGDRLIRLWNVETGDEIRRCAGHEHWVNSVAFANDGARILSGSTDHTVRIWDSATGDEIGKLQGHTHNVQIVVVTPDSRRAVSGGHDKTARVWDLDKKIETAKFTNANGSMISLATLPDNKRFLAGSDDGWVRLIDLDTGKELSSFRPTSGWITGLAVSPNGRYGFASSTDKIIRIWEVETQKIVHQFEGHRDWVQSVALSRDGRWLLSGGGGKIDGNDWKAGDDLALRLWEVPAFARIPAVAVKPEPAAFALVARGDQPERSFKTLKQAVSNVNDGDIIEVRGNGPFVTDPVVIKDRALTLRAAAGTQPVLAMSADGLGGREPLLRTNASLVLEGLELQRLGSQPFAEDSTVIGVVVADNADLTLNHCRLMINRREGPQFGIHCVHCFGNFTSPKCELKNTIVLATGGAAVSTGGGETLLENCLIAGEYGLLLFRAPDHDRKIRIALRNNTILARHAIQWNLRGENGEAADPRKTWICETRDNIFTGNVCFNQEGKTLGDNDYLPEKAMTKLLPKIIDWRENGNLLGPDDELVQLSGDFKKLSEGSGIRTIEDWKRLWSLQGSTSQLGTPRFESGASMMLAHKAYTTPTLAKPEDFRLRSDSPGRHAGENKKNLGADVDEVGPGRPPR